MSLLSKAAKLAGKAKRIAKKVKPFVPVIVAVGSVVAPGVVRKGRKLVEKGRRVIGAPD